MNVTYIFCTISVPNYEQKQFIINVVNTCRCCTGRRR